MDSSWPFEITPIGRVAVGGLRWRARGLDRATVIVKATFSLVHDGLAALVAPVPVRVKEAHLNDSPLLGVVAPSDLSPYLQLADVLLTGHAYAPGGGEVPELLARLGVVRGQVTVLDKAVSVLGDRVAKRDEAAPAPKPFRRMPLTYDRAYGGPGFQDNPLGVGRAADADGNRKLPNLLYPGGQGPTMVAGFAPLARALPARKKLLKPGDKQRLDQPVLEIPDGFDLAYFQSAPEDQRTTYLQGDEWILLLGMNRDHELLRTRLPQVRSFARATIPGQPEQTLALALDTLLIDVDAEQLTLVWRGSVAAKSEQLAELRVAAGVDLFGAPLVFPAPDAVASVHAMPPPPPPPRSAPISPRVDPKDFAGTVMLEEGTSTPAATSPPPNDRTITIDAPSHVTGPLPSPVLPFAASAPSSRRPQRGEIPGAPWAVQTVEPAPAPANALEGTLALDGLPVFEGPLPSKPPSTKPRDPVPADEAVTAPIPPPLKERVIEVGTASVAKDDPYAAQEPPPPPAPPPKREPPKPSVNESLYRRFGRK